MIPLADEFILSIIPFSLFSKDLPLWCLQIHQGSDTYRKIAQKGYGAKRQNGHQVSCSHPFYYCRSGKSFSQCHRTGPVMAESHVWGTVAPWSNPSNGQTSIYCSWPVSLL